MWEPSNTPEIDRMRKLNHLREQGIPSRILIALSERILPDRAIEAFEAVETEDHQTPEPVRVTVCGRIVRQNLKGKIYFAHIEDGDGRLQLICPLLTASANRPLIWSGTILTWATLCRRPGR